MKNQPTKGWFFNYECKQVVGNYYTVITSQEVNIGGRQCGDKEMIVGGTYSTLNSNTSEVEVLPALSLTITIQ